MDLTIALISGLGLLAGSILVHIIAIDVHHNTPRVARWLIHRAASLLPEVARERYREEWLAHLDDCVGAVSKLAHALGCIICAHNLRKTVLKEIVAVAEVRIANQTELLNEQSFIMLYACVSRMVEETNEVDPTQSSAIERADKMARFFRSKEGLLLSKDFPFVETEKLGRLMGSWGDLKDSYDWHLKIRRPDSGLRHYGKQKSI